MHAVYASICTAVAIKKQHALESYGALPSFFISMSREKINLGCYTLSLLQVTSCIKGANIQGGQIEVRAAVSTRSVIMSKPQAIKRAAAT